MGASFAKASSRPRKSSKPKFTKAELEARGVADQIARDYKNAQSALAQANLRKESTAGTPTNKAKYVKQAKAAVQAAASASSYATQATKYYQAGKMSETQYYQAMSYAVSQSKAGSIGGQQTAKQQRERGSFLEPLKQSFDKGFTVATKEQGFVSTPAGKGITGKEAIKTQAQDTAQAQAAFTTTKQKIEAKRAAKAQALEEARTPPSKIEVIREDARIITRMISPREQAEQISKDKVKPRQIGPVQTAAILTATTSGQFAKKIYTSPTPEPVPKIEAVVGSISAPMILTKEEYKVDPGTVYDYPQPSTPVAKALESTLTKLEQWQSYQPKNILEEAGKKLVDPAIGFLKATGSTSAFFYNLGTQASAAIMGREPRVPQIKTPPTIYTTVSEQVIEGKSAEQVLLSVGKYAHKYGISSTMGELGEVGLGLPGIQKAAVILPLKYLAPKVAMGSKVVPISRSLELGYGKYTIPLRVSYAKAPTSYGKFYPERAATAITQPKILGPTGKSSFEVMPMADYSPAELRKIIPTLKTFEKSGVIKAGKLTQAIEEGKTLKAVVKSKPITAQLTKEYKKIRPAEDLASFSPGIKSKETLIAVGKAQKKGLVQEIKGSDIFKQLKGFPFAKGLVRGDIDITAETTAKGIKAAEQIVKVGAKPGYALERIGSNVAIGRAATVAKPIYPKIGPVKPQTVLHGTDIESARIIKDFGINVSASKRGSAFFTSQTVGLAKQFATRASIRTGKPPAIVKLKVKKGKVLPYEKLTPIERNIVSTKNWLAFQKNIEYMAKEKGFLAATKPYIKKTVSKETLLKTPTKELIIYDKSAVSKITKIIEPTMKIKTDKIITSDAKKFLNIVTPQEELKSIAVLPGKERFYGMKYPKDVFKQRIEGSNQMLKEMGLRRATIDLQRSASGVISRTALKEGGLAEKDIEMILGKSEVTIGPLGHRYTKDITRGYLGQWKLAQVAFKTGETDIAKRIGSNMGKRIKEEKAIDWKKDLRVLLTEKVTKEVQIKPPIKSPSSIPSIVKPTTSALGITKTTESIKSPVESPKIQKPSVSATSPTSVKSPSIFSPKIPSVSAKIIPSIFSLKTPSPASIKSPKIFSPKSPKPSVSVESPSIFSPKITKPPVSVKPTSVTSSKIQTSVSVESPSNLSPKIQSPVSVKPVSISSPKSIGSIKPKSITSPKSPKSPVSPKSIVSVSPKSITSPKSPKSPVSPGSPGSPGKPGRPPTPKPIIKPIGSVFFKPQRRIIAAPIWWKTKQEKRIEEHKQYRKPFLGGVHQEEITGWRTTITDIDYGKKVVKLARKDIQFTRKKKGMKKFVKETKINILGKPSRYFTPTKEQSKLALRF